MERDVSGAVVVGTPSLREWLKINLRIGALSFGGSVRHFLFHDFLVRDRRWITEDEFQQALSLGQVLPGPNLINLCAYLGHRLFGTRGAVLGIVALCLPGALMGISVLSLLDLSQPHWILLFRGFSLGSLSLFALFILRIAPGICTRANGQKVARSKKHMRYALALSICVLALLEVPMVPLLVGGAVVGSFVERSVE